LPKPVLTLCELKITSLDDDDDDAVVVMVTELSSESNVNATSKTGVSPDCCWMT